MSKHRGMYHGSWMFPMAFALVAIGVLWAIGLQPTIWHFYSQHLRASLFAGFLSAGGFLLALKTFILIKMKEEVYAKERYHERYRRAQKRNSIKEPLYAPLQRLGDFLFMAIVSAFATAALQLTLGLYPHAASAFACIGSSIFTTCTFFVCLWVVRSNLNLWFELLDEELRIVQKKPNEEAPPPLRANDR